MRYLLVFTLLLISCAQSPNPTAALPPTITVSAPTPSPSPGATSTPAPSATAAPSPTATPVQTETMMCERGRSDNTYLVTYSVVSGTAYITVSSSKCGFSATFNTPIHFNNRSCGIYFDGTTVSCEGGHDDD